MAEIGGCCGLRRSCLETVTTLHSRGSAAAALAVPTVPDLLNLRSLVSTILSPLLTCTRSAT